MNDRSLPYDVEDLVTLLRDEIEDQLLTEETAAGSPRSASLREVHAAFTRALTRDPGDEVLLHDLDAAKAGLESVLASLDAEERARDASLYEEPLRMLASVRSRAMDVLVTISVHDTSAAVLPFRASRGGPTLYDAPLVPSPELLEVPRPWDEDPPDVPEDAPALTALPRGEVEQELDRLARDALEDIGIMGNLRRLEDHERWIDSREFEARLLANLDALWSLDRPELSEWPRLGVPAAAWRYLTEWALPDWGRAFAFAFALGCTSSNAALRWVLLGMRRSPAPTHSAYVDALALASSPDIDEAILRLLTDSSNPAPEAALSIAFRRRLFTVAGVVPWLTHLDVAVVLAGIRCLRHAPAEVAREVLSTARSDERGPVRLAALRELCAHGDGSARQGLRQILDESRHRGRDEAEGIEALRLLALLGDPLDNDRVLDGALAYPEATHLLGNHGAPAHLDALLAAVARARDATTDPLRLARLEEAVRRLTGIDPSGDLEAIRVAARTAFGASPAPRVRYGVAYSRDAVVDELRSPRTKQGDRRDLVLELAMGWPEVTRIDVETWVARQEAEIGAVPRARRR